MSGILANSFSSADVTPVWAEVLVILVRVLIPLKYNQERKTYKKRGRSPLSQNLKTYAANINKKKPRRAYLLILCIHPFQDATRVFFELILVIPELKVIAK